MHKNGKRQFELSLFPVRIMPSQASRVKELYYKSEIMSPKAIFLSESLLHYRINIASRSDWRTLD